MEAVGKADLILRDPDGWGTSAFERRRRIDDPGLGSIWVTTVEDLLLAKLEFTDGNLDGLQGRDCIRIAQATPGPSTWRTCASTPRPSVSCPCSTRSWPVPAESPGERVLLEHVLREDPEARAARRAHERWVTAQRLWAAIDRAGITDDGDRARFIASRLWPACRALWWRPS